MIKCPIWELPEKKELYLSISNEEGIIDGHEIKSPAWVIGSIHRGVSHSSTEIRLLESAKPDYYEQIELSVNTD